jgi:hypothetical protein
MSFYNFRAFCSANENGWNGLCCVWDVSVFGILIMKTTYAYYYGGRGFRLDKRQLRRMLKRMGYSDEAVEAVLRWYE